MAIDGIQGGKIGLGIGTDGFEVGRHPENISASEYAVLSHKKKRLLSVIREKCLDCCCQQISEVRKCVMTDCPLWPYRMNSNPFRSKARKGIMPVSGFGREKTP